MKIASNDNPVRTGWLTEQGLRLDAAPYLSGAFAAKQLLKRLPVDKNFLADLTEGHNGGFSTVRSSAACTSTIPKSAFRSSAAPT